MKSQDLCCNDLSECYGFLKEFSPISMPSNFHRSLTSCFRRLILVLPLSGLLAASSVVSDAGGFSKVAVPPGGRVVAPLFANPPLFQAGVAVNGQTLSVSGLTASSWNALSPGTPGYYAEVVSGPFEGMRFDILSNSAGAITIAGDASALNGQTNLPVCVRRHTTLGGLASSSTGLSDYSDAFTLYRSNNVKASYYYTSSGVLADDYATPADQTVIPPGAAVILNSQGSATITFSGHVKPNRTMVPLFAGENLVAPVDPVGGARLTAQNLASSLAPRRDMASLISVDGRFSSTRFYSDGSSILDSSFAPVSTNSAPSLSVGNGFVITASSAGTWTNLPVSTN